VKALQRTLVEIVLSKLPVHTSATAYRIGKSIKDNAAAHAQNGPILKFDFQDFFPSILARDWQGYCDATKIFDDLEDVALTTNILFHRKRKSTMLRLAIGAPSSPCLSNVLMYRFDSIIAKLVSAEQVTYTRYADDITFSARRTGYLVNVEKILRRVISQLTSPRLKINEDKTVLATRKYRRTVTGLVITNDGNVSIGRDRKRRIRAAVHHAAERLLSVEEQARLAGVLAFAGDVEPQFIARLIEKFGMAVFDDLKSSVRLLDAEFDSSLISTLDAMKKK